MSCLWKIKWTAKCAALVHRSHWASFWRTWTNTQQIAYLMHLDYLTLNASYKSLWNKSQHVSKTWLYSLENTVGYSNLFFFSRTLWHFENCCSTQKKASSKLCADTSCVKLFINMVVWEKDECSVNKHIKNPYTCSSGGLLFCLTELRKIFGWPISVMLTGYLHRMPRMQKWTCLRGSEWTPFVDTFFTQQCVETRQPNSKNSQRFIIIVFSL